MAKAETKEAGIPWLSVIWSARHYLATRTMDADLNTERRLSTPGAAWSALDQAGALPSVGPGRSLKTDSSAPNHDSDLKILLSERWPRWLFHSGYKHQETVNIPAVLVAIRVKLGIAGNLQHAFQLLELLSCHIPDAGRLFRRNT